MSQLKRMRDLLDQESENGKGAVVVSEMPTILHGKMPTLSRKQIEKSIRNEIPALRADIEKDGKFLCQEYEGKKIKSIWIGTKKDSENANKGLAKRAKAHVSTRKSLERGIEAVIKSGILSLPDVKGYLPE